jgi:hypothetical protein
MASRLALYIGYNFGLVALYLFIWQPLLSKLNTELWRTKSMLKMIPIHVMAKIRSVRHYLKDLLQ